MKTVPLYGEVAAGRVALVSDEDFELVSRYRWNALERIRPGRRTEGPYPTTNAPSIWGPRISTPMHKLLTGWPLVDHINHDGLDNQRGNLRPATELQNLANQRKRLGCASIYKGVTWHPANSKWRARVKINGKARSLGLFVSEIDAARAYDAAAREVFGEFACLNFP